MDTVIKKIRKSILKNKKFRLNYTVDENKNNLVSVDKIPNYIKLISDFKNIDLRKTHGVFIATPAKSFLKLLNIFRK